MIIAVGFVMEPNTYLRDAWNRVDACVVVMAGLGLAYSPFTAFRSLRTLRLIIRSSQLRTVIKALLGTLPSVTQGLAVCGFMYATSFPRPAPPSLNPHVDSPPTGADMCIHSMRSRNVSAAHTLD